MDNFIEMCKMGDSETEKTFIQSKKQCSLFFGLSVGFKIGMPGVHKINNWYSFTCLLNTLWLLAKRLLKSCESMTSDSINSKYASGVLNQ